MMSPFAILLICWSTSGFVVVTQRLPSGAALQLLARTSGSRGGGRALVRFHDAETAAEGMREWWAGEWAWELGFPRGGPAGPLPALPLPFFLQTTLGFNKRNNKQDQIFFFGKLC